MVKKITSVTFITISAFVLALTLFCCENSTMVDDGKDQYSGDTLTGTSWISISSYTSSGILYAETRKIKFSGASKWNYSCTVTADGEPDPSLSVNSNGTYLFKDKILTLKLGSRVIITAISYDETKMNYYISVDGNQYYQEDLFASK